MCIYIYIYIDIYIYIYIDCINFKYKQQWTFCSWFRVGTTAFCTLEYFPLKLLQLLLTTHEPASLHLPRALVIRWKSTAIGTGGTAQVGCCKAATSHAISGLGCSKLHATHAAIQLPTILHRTHATRGFRMCVTRCNAITLISRQTCRTTTNKRAVSALTRHPE